MHSYSTILLRFSAIFAMIGVFLGSHMAGSGGYGALLTVHAHILVVGWLSLFAWAVYYKVFRTKKSLLATLHVWSAIIGTIGLTVGMWLYMVNPFDMSGPFPLLSLIIGGSILLVSFLFFLILTFMKSEEIA